jgi:putative salt-induced outer membrane protein
MIAKPSKEIPMLKQFLVAALALAPMAAVADNGWSGTGEFGLVVARGNADTDTVNAKLNLKHEDDQWLQEGYVLGLRSQQNGNANAQRFEIGAKNGYKLDERSYIIGTVRYENDDFSPFDYQSTFSVGYGYKAIDTAETKLSFEAGPGYKRVKPVDGDSEGKAFGRGYAEFKHKLTETTDLIDTLLVEGASGNTFIQNDLGLQVKINSSLALKAALQVRHNSDVPASLDKTDTLTTINVVYGFK